MVTEQREIPPSLLRYRASLLFVAWLYYNHRISDWTLEQPQPPSLIRRLLFVRYLYRHEHITDW